MLKVKLTKGELKKQRDALKQYLRYLPTLQLKKQQLQIEILQQAAKLQEKKATEAGKRKAAEVWAGLLVEAPAGLKKWVQQFRVLSSSRNVAGVDVPVFERVEFSPYEYDLFSVPLWVDAALEALKNLVCLREEISVVAKGIDILTHELRITAQRVNLFEKVKIPETQEAIRLIRIYIGDQMSNAVGRSKIAKKKIERLLLEEVAV